MRIKPQFVNKTGVKTRLQLHQKMELEPLLEKPKTSANTSTKEEVAASANMVYMGIDSLYHFA